MDKNNSKKVFLVNIKEVITVLNKLEYSASLTGEPFLYFEIKQVHHFTRNQQHLRTQFI